MKGALCNSSATLKDDIRLDLTKEVCKLPFYFVGSWRKCFEKAKATDILVLREVEC